MKNLEVLILILGSYALMSISCSKNENPPPPNGNTSVMPFVADFDDNIFPPASLGLEPSPNVYPEILDSGYVEIVSDTVRDGGYALKITVSPDFQTQSSPQYPVKNRMEVNYHHDNVEGTEVWYQWSFLIPTYYIELDPNLYPNSFNIIGQFHAVADPENGMPSAAGTNPVVALYLGRETINGPFGVRLNYGIMNDNVGPAGYFTVTKGEWVDFKMHIKWSRYDDIGFIEAWANDSLITGGKFYGKNMHNTQPHYWKTGFYRGKEPLLPYNNSIFIDEFRVGNSESEVSIQ